MGLVIIIVAAVSGIIGIWAEVITGESEEVRQKENPRSLWLKAISSFLAVIALIAGYYEWQDSNDRESQQKLAYKRLDSTFQVAVQTGKAVTNISGATKSIVDGVKGYKNEIDKFSQEQTKTLKEINSQTTYLLNPIPEDIYVAWGISFKVDEWYANSLNREIRNTKNPERNGYGFALNDSILGGARNPIDAIGNFIGLTLEIRTAKDTISYRGDLVSNFDLPYLGVNQSLNKNATLFNEFFYDSSTMTIAKFDGLAQLKREFSSKNLTSLIQLDTCDVIFSAEIIEAMAFDRRNLSIEFVAVGFNSKIEKTFRNVKYDMKEMGFRIRKAKISN